MSTSLRSPRIMPSLTTLLFNDMESQICFKVELKKKLEKDNN